MLLFTVPPSQPVQTAQNIIKYRAMFAYDATREDELSIKEGDLINVFTFFSIFKYLFF